MVESGRSVVNLTDKDLALMRIQRSVPDDHIRVDYTVSDVALHVMNGVPLLSGVDGSGVATGDTSTFTVQRGEMLVSPGHKLVLADGKFDVPSTDPKPAPAVITAHVLGSMDAAADILSRDALKPFANVPIDASAVKGQVDAHLGIALKLGEHVPADDVKVTATADVANFSADKLIGKEGLVDTTLQLVADKTGLHAKGEGRMYGAPATLDLRKPAGNGPSEAVIALVLDDAARAKAGLGSLGKSLTGIVTARISTSLSQGDKAKALVDLDFTKASIDGLLPGFSKPAGRPGKATLSVTQRDGANTVLDNIVFDGGGASLRGSAELRQDGTFDSAKLSQVRLSPGDDLRLDASQSGDGLKLVARGANFDARPFLKWLSGPSAAGPEGPSNGKSVDVELHSNVLTGQNSQAMTNADVRFSRRNGQVRSLQVTGRFGRQPVSVTTVQQDGAPILVVHSSDAGDTLAFMDLYKRMVGGRLEAKLSLGLSRLDGNTKIYDFTIREDPNIKKLAQQGLANQPRNNDGPAALIDASVVPFTKLEASFIKMGNRVSIREGALYGPQIGATVSGSLDFERNQVNLEGTFVPLYGVNNLFSQIPLFGPILGGGTREGLFGVNYRITGSAAAPVLSVNPLSAIAPGFLRNVFGAIDDANFGDAEPRDRASGPPQLSLPGQ